MPQFIMRLKTQTFLKRAVAAGVFSNVFAHYQAVKWKAVFKFSFYAGFNAETYTFAENSRRGGQKLAVRLVYVGFGIRQFRAVWVAAESREGSGVSATTTTGSTIVLTTGVAL